jgi:sulfate adenylyltransferase subunit 2
LDHLHYLETEAIEILRETAFQFERPFLLFSGGKDSICMVHLARLAFAPNPIPFTLLHIDTGHNFTETLTFRDELVLSMGLSINVRSVVEAMRKREIPEPKMKFPSRNAMQSFALLDAIQELNIDACIGGGRRDEDKARAKERIFSVRNHEGTWNPLSQRPEPWNMLNGRINPGENVRVFPLSNWTELDVWNYIQREQIALPSLYFSHERLCLELPDGALMGYNPYVLLESTDVLVERSVRFRTIGDMTCTAAIPSNASTIEEVIAELNQTQLSERGATRLDDRISEAGMEDRKRQGYF